MIGKRRPGEWRPRALGVAVLLGASVVLAGCVSSAEGRRMRQDIDTLDARFEELSNSLGNDRQRLTDLLLTAEEEITQLREALDQAQTILQRNSADLGVQLDTLESDLQELRGQVEHAEFRLSQLEQQLMLFMEDIDTRLGN